MGQLQRLLRVPEAAALLGLKPSTIRKLIYLGQIKVCRPSRRAVRVPEAEIRRIQHAGMVPRGPRS
jgi:excisionase family DNA binding protein